MLAAPVEGRTALLSTLVAGSPPPPEPPEPLSEVVSGSGPADSTVVEVSGVGVTGGSMVLVGVIVGIGGGVVDAGGSVVGSVVGGVVAGCVVVGSVDGVVGGVVGGMTVRTSIREGRAGGRRPRPPPASSRRASGTPT